MARVIVLQVIAGIIGGFIAAKKGRGVLMWSLLCFIFPLLTIVIAILPTMIGPAIRRCPQCSRPIKQHENVCSSCREEKPIELVQCRKCGSYIPDHKDCPVCDQLK